MSTPTPRTPVSVTIGGEEYKLRSDATADYTRECAAYVDRALEELVQQGGVMDGHRAAILAALSITDQLFRARAETELLRSEVARLAARLATDVEDALAPQDLAAGSRS